MKKTYPLSYGPQSDGSLSPEFVIETLGKIAGPDAVYVAGVGQHQMWAAQFISYEKPRTWLNSGGLGTMGYAIPAAMGAKLARPDAEVWAIDGDGCFQMTNQELATCAIEGAPIKVAIINNGNLGMVRQWQTLFYDQRYSQTDLATHSHRIPDFVKLAEALGCVGLRCEREEDVVDVINQARAINDRPGGDRLHRRRRRAGVADGRRRHRATTRSRPRAESARCSTRRNWAAMDCLHAHVCRCSSKTSPASWPGSRRCSRGVASTSSRWPSAPPSRKTCRG